jgi:pantothenate kinase
MMTTDMKLHNIPWSVFALLGDTCDSISFRKEENHENDSQTKMHILANMGTYQWVNIIWISQTSISWYSEHIQY